MGRTGGRKLKRRKEENLRGRKEGSLAEGKKKT
jgi:hypothetical protein